MTAVSSLRAFFAEHPLTPALLFVFLRCPSSTSHLITIFKFQRVMWRLYLLHFSVLAHVGIVIFESEAIFVDEYWPSRSKQRTYSGSEVSDVVALSHCLFMWLFWKFWDGQRVCGQVFCNFVSNPGESSHNIPTLFLMFKSDWFGQNNLYYHRFNTTHYCQLSFLGSLFEDLDHSIVDSPRSGSFITQVLMFFLQSVDSIIFCTCVSILLDFVIHSGCSLFSPVFCVVGSPSYRRRHDRNGHWSDGANSVSHSITNYAETLIYYQGAHAMLAGTVFQLGKP
jgi:hypothetical protein